VIGWRPPKTLPWKAAALTAGGVDVELDEFEGQPATSRPTRPMASAGASTRRRAAEK